MAALTLTISMISLCCAFTAASTGILNSGTFTLLAVGALYFILYLAHKNFLPKKIKPERWAEKLTSVLTICFFAVCICHGALSVAFARFNPPPQDIPTTVIVLGCQLDGDEPSPMLKRRLDTAAAYLQKNPQAMCVVSGGVGENNIISEAEAMQNYLLRQGVSQNRIYTENSSKNTRQNLHYSMQKIRNYNLSDHAVISTDGFHQFRAYIYAKQAGFSKINAVSGFTPPALAMVYSVREFFAVLQALFLV
ncbi:MAG: YdcF family protein [Oscillospiraceae bacterium]|nr:YdcF family protein [Oscillospiraceae bacterium]